MHRGTMHRVLIGVVLATAAAGCEYKSETVQTRPPAATTTVAAPAPASTTYVSPTGSATTVTSPAPATATTVYTR